MAAEDGPRPIESIVEGQLVWAYDLVAGGWRLRRVLRTYSRRCEGLAASVAVGGETIVSTSRHPYFVIRGDGLESRPRLPHLAETPDDASTPGRWVDAGDLRVGDELLPLDGRAARIEDVRLYPFLDAVYNFEVDDLHCYAVGRSGVLVHNNNGPEIPAQNKPSAATKVVETPETTAPKPVKPSDATKQWEDFLGPGEPTDIHPRTGVPDPNRLVSPDGTRSIRYGNHEMNSKPTKHHYHEETWTYDPVTDTMTVDNQIVRVPLPPK